MKRKKIVLVIFASIMIAALMPLFSTLADSNPGDLLLSKGETSEFGGGRYIEVNSGNGRIGIVYGTSRVPNHIIIYSAGSRTIGELDLFEGSRLIKKEIVRVRTLVTEEIEEIIEFRDINNNSRFESLIGEHGEYNLTRLDYPVRGVKLKEFSGGFPKIEKVSDKEISVTFRLIISNPRENMQWNDVKGRMEEVQGKKIADMIEMDFQINVTFREDVMPLQHYTVSGNSVSNAGKLTRKGTVCETNLHYSYRIDGWKFKYPDSKIFLKTKRGMFIIPGSERFMDKGAYANITTSTPRYLELNGSKSLSGIRPLYGHSIRLFLERQKIGYMAGNTISVVDEKNRSYVIMLAGEYPENTEFMEKKYEGFTLFTTSAYWQGNVNCGERISLTYTSVSPFEMVDATPSWLMVAPFEAAFMSFLGLYLSYKRFR